MGTRHLIAVMQNENYKVAQYGQWDGYPSGQGLTTLNFLQAADLDKFKENLQKVRFTEPDGRDKAFLDSYNQNAPKWSSEPDNRTPEQIKWFNCYISRDLGADILGNITSSDDPEILLRNSIDFAGDSLFCEYAYVIDFDKQTFEVFQGFNGVALGADERFVNTKTDGNYHPVRIIATYDLASLPSTEEFLALETDEEED